MEDGSSMWHLILLGVSVIVQGILYGFGAASQELNESEIEKKAEEGDRHSQMLFKIMDSPVKYINAMHMCVTFMNFALGATAVDSVSRMVTNMCREAGWFGSLNQSFCGTVVTILVLLVFMSLFVSIGIMAPKKIAIKYPEKLSYGLLPFARFVMIICTPLGAVITLITNLIGRIFGVDPKDNGDDVTEEEIISMVMEGHEQGVLEANEAEMIHNIFLWGDTEAKDIMTHRTSICAVDKNMGLSDSLNYMLENKNSRYPVYDGEIDNVIGILYLRDVIDKVHREKALREVPVGEIKGLIREAKFVPETKNIDEIFKTMQAEKSQMVIVIDEYGQAAGLITMEDILEEIVGNILDEYDEEELFITEENDGSYQMEGLTPLDEVGEKLGISFEGIEFETLNGFLTSLLERIPGEDETPEISYNGYNFKVLSVENNIISSVEVTRQPEVEKAEEEE